MKKILPWLSPFLATCSPTNSATDDIAATTPAETSFNSTTPTPTSTEGTPTNATTDIPTTGGASTGDGTAGGTAGGPPICGNSIIEGEEICDDGYDGNKPENQCTHQCRPATCGDGHTQPSNQETCDDGLQNAADPAYNQCSTACIRGPHCGDGILQADAGEECEQSGDNDNNCAGMCRHKPRILFLTDALFSGNLGGLAGADKKCNEFAAEQPGLTGTYRAWLLVDGQSLGDRFPEFTAPVAWNFTNTSAGLLAKSFAELVEHGPAEPVAYTQSGAAAPKMFVWTGITKDGLAAGGDCAQWTSEDGSPALTGHSGYVPNVGPDALQWRLDRRWTDRGFKTPCLELQQFYCLQVAD